MKTKMILSFVLAVIFISCEMEEDDPKMSGTFTVTVENVLQTKTFFLSGVFNTPVGASEPGGAGPGNSYEFSFQAGKGHKLSFSTMYVKSNDLFYAPDGEGIALYDGDDPVTGDITSHVFLWDAGTEVNEEPGKGSDQPLNQGSPNTGEEENGKVWEISSVNDGYTYPSVMNTLKVTLSNDGGTSFTLKIENLSGSTTPIAPGVWVVHSESNPLFEAGMEEPGHGLEALAEDGDPTSLASWLEENSGFVSPLAPGVYAVHDPAAMPLFTNGSVDFGEGLEALAEDGDPSSLNSSLDGKAMVITKGVFNTPASGSSPGPIFPGEKYEFTFEAKEGDKLSFATMLVQTNDLFFAPADDGINLWSGETAISGDITGLIQLWDAGTEVNEYPGAGLHQPPRINGGETENGVVEPVDDAFEYLPVNEIIKVSISHQ